MPSAAALAEGYEHLSAPTPATQELLDAARGLWDAANFHSRTGLDQVEAVAARLPALPEPAAEAPRWLIEAHAWVAVGRAICWNGQARFADALAAARLAQAGFAQSGHTRGEGLAWRAIGHNQYRLGDLPGSIESQNRALGLALDLQHLDDLASAYAGLAMCYRGLDDLGRAQELDSLSLDAARASGDRRMVARSLANYAIGLNLLKKPEEARQCFAEAAQIGEEVGDLRLRCFALYNHGASYDLKTRPVEAEQTYQQAMTLARQLGERMIECYCWTGLALCLLERGQTQQAITYARTGYQMAQALNIPTARLSAQVQTATIYLRLGEAQAADDLLHEGMADPANFPARDNLTNWYMRRVETAKALGRWEVACQRLEELRAYEQKQLNEASDRRYRNLQVIHEVRQAQQMAEAERQRSRALAEVNAELAQQRDAVAMLHGKVQTQRDQLAELYQQLRESLSYGARFQAAVLARPTAWAAHFGDRWLLHHQPRDEVSGDFSWLWAGGGTAAEPAPVLFVALADCTGHGVPGAFMSFLGASLLRQVIDVQGLRDPGAILEALHQQVWGLLADETGPRDGMEIALLRLQPAADRPGEVAIHWAGARLGLLVTGGGALAEAQWHTGQRFAIGQARKRSDQTYQTRELDLPAGAAIYAFTDGWPDQDGPDGRRLGSLRTRQLLLAVAGKPWPEQATLLRDALRRHQLAQPQRDDITILGFDPAAWPCPPSPAGA